MRGRKPKPTKLKILHGSREPINECEAIPKKGLPKPPACLTGEGKKEWRRVAAELAPIGLLTSCDMAIFAAYCRAWANFVEATKQTERLGIMLESGNGVLYQNPWVAVANKASEHLAKFGAQMGLDPTSRSRIHVDAASKDSFEDYLNDVATG